MVSPLKSFERPLKAFQRPLKAFEWPLKVFKKAFEWPLSWWPCENWLVWVLLVEREKHALCQSTCQSLLEVQERPEIKAFKRFLKICSKVRQQSFKSAFKQSFKSAFKGLQKSFKRPYKAFKSSLKRLSKAFLVLLWVPTCATQQTRNCHMLESESRKLHVQQLWEIPFSRGK